jgi:hypothetical protein
VAVVVVTNIIIREHQVQEEPLAVAAVVLIMDMDHLELEHEDK